MALSFLGNSKTAPPWGATIAAILVFTTAAIGVGVWQRSRPQETLADLTLPVAVEDLTLRITASGTIVPIQTVNLSPKTAGRLVELYVEQGDRVQQGQIIARMSNEDLQAQRLQAEANLKRAQANLAELRAGSRTEEIAQARANLERTQAQVQAAQARLDLATERVARNQALFDDGAIARDRLDEAISEADSARANLAQAQAQVREAQQRLTQLQNGTRSEQIAQGVAQVREAEGRLKAITVQLDDTIIRAPFAGIITQRYAEPGSFVTPTTSASTTASATSTSIVALANGLEVLAKVPEVDIGQIRLNQTVEIVADAYPDRVFKGRVRLIAPEAIVEQNVTSFQVRIVLDSGRDVLRSGMNVDVTFLGDQVRDALVVPTVAIVTREGQTGVLVPGPKDKPKFVPVTIGPTIGNQTQILSGIQAGDRIFVDLPDEFKRQESPD